MLIALVMVVTSCSKSDDPTPSTPSSPSNPTAQSNLDKVKATLSGTWTFQQFVITEVSSGKTKTITTCDKTSFTGFFSNATSATNLTPEFNFIYVSGTSVNGINQCPTPAPPTIYAVTVVENTDHSVTLTLDAGGSAKYVYSVNANDITATSIKATLVSKGNGGSYLNASTEGYLVVYTYTRS